MIPQADHLLGLAEFLELPEDNSRHYELQDGVLIARPHPELAHQRAVSGLALALNEQLPGAWSCLFCVEVVTKAEYPACVRVPDVVVYAEDLVGADAPALTAQQVLVAVEVLSPGSVSTDTVLKPVEYARAGIPNYWVVDLAGAGSLTAYRLHEGAYRVAARAEGLFETDYPFPLTVDLTALHACHARMERKVDQ
ncbi:Uma2 family endonuclease [Kutzneria viridogrisea]|uniref:Uma2 family endonuclease n=2 Tax=Kutzneria TaxID=43356 RepID=A0ABR6BZ82_9PSEU|nr:Uma2 family endonuclease [Kutzneria albida]AHH97088.1 hypothetical protein KALB_3724 [Kutzneria albida DSM 43870]MBA8931941.1 Uma2 family endonuclease [Kutzneria viridogrisea]